MRKVLIANRGEIAVRIARGCRDAGLASVAVFADADRGAVHVRAADDAVPLHGATPAKTYLDMGKVLEAAVNRGATNLPLHRALVTEEAFAPADPARPFSVHTGWLGSVWPASALPGA